MALSKGLGYDAINNVVTDFPNQHTIEQLEQLADSTLEQVDQFVESHLMVSTAICTLLSGVGGTVGGLISTSGQC